MLTRELDSDGRAHWMWSAAESVFNLTLAGLPADLASVAGWLALPASDREAMLQAAPVAPPSRLTQQALPGRPGKILALGRNFAAHAHEMGAEPSLHDMLWFGKLPDIFVATGAEIEVPAWLPGRVDPEAELVVLLGAPLRNASEAEATAALVGWSLGNDLTARGVQAEDKEKAWPWLRSKNVAGFGSVGPGWLPADLLPPWEELELQGLVNGEIRQQARLNDMLYTPARAVAELSRWLPLMPGDIVFLGTPSGVAAVQDGDVMEVRLVDAQGDLPLDCLRNTLRRPS